MSVYKKTGFDALANFIIGVILAVMAVCCLYPVLYIVFASFSDPMRLTQHTGLLFSPLGFTLEGYKVAMGYGNIWSGYLNTIYIVVVGTTVNMLLTILAAYVTAKKEMYIHKLLNFFVIFTMFFSGGLIPTFLVVKNLNLIDNFWALILPVAINTWNLIILRTTMNGLPASLEESAKIDGANDFIILFKIVVPLVKATLAVLVLYYIVGHWNSWFNAMLYMKDRNKYPLQLILREILIANTSNAASSMGIDLTEMNLYKQLVKYCTTVIVTAPILFIYPFLQKYFVKGVLVGSVKG